MYLKLLRGYGVPGRLINYKQKIPIFWRVLQTHGPRPKPIKIKQIKGRPLQSHLFESQQSGLFCDPM